MVNAAQLQAAVQEALLAQQEAQQAEIAVRIQNAVQAALAAQQPPPPAPEGYTSPYNTPLPNLTHAPFSDCLLYTSPSPRDATLSRMPSSA